MIQTSKHNQINTDLQMAKDFFAIAEIGKARVSARKAAGEAAQVWVSKNYPQKWPGLNPFQALEKMHELSIGNEDFKVHLERLLMKVDTNYNLPANVDLIASAEFIIQNILKED